MDRKLVTRQERAAQTMKRAAVKLDGPPITARGNWTDGECFYVDAIDGERVALLAGPFRTLPEAEARVDEARRLALDYGDPKAHWYAYGCSKWSNGHRAGRFNKELGL